jgi:hypothetical protein
MSRTTIGPSQTCPFASNCSCVFSRPQSIEGMPTVTDTALHDEAVSAEVTNWTDLGWKVVRSSSHEVVLERQKSLPFCLNVLLCLVTGFLWLIYWIPRARNPRIDTKVVSLV